MSAIAPMGSAPPELPADLASPEFRPGAPSAAQGATVPFGQLLSEGLSQVNHDLVTSQVEMQRLATGDIQNLHQVMIRLEESRISFQLMLQVRGRLLEAYQDVMRMQI